MANVKLFLLLMAISYSLGLKSADTTSCAEQFYQHLAWYDNKIDTISKKSAANNEDKFTEKCRVLALLVARVMDSGCQLSTFEYNVLGQRHRSMLASGATSCWAAGPLRPTIQSTNPSFTLPFFTSSAKQVTTSSPSNEVVGNRNTDDNPNPCDIKVRNCYLQFQINLTIRSGFQNLTCGIIDSFAKCLIALPDCGFPEHLKPQIIKEAIFHTPFRIWETKQCRLDIQIPTIISTLTAPTIFRWTTTAPLPTAQSRNTSTTVVPSVTHSPNDCGRATFRCHNGNCVTVGQICNAVDDCGDTSDEIACDNAENLIALQIEQTFAKYSCYDVMSNCTSLHVMPLLLLIRVGEQPDPETLCRSSNNVFQCAVYQSCPLSVEDQYKVAALLIKSFERIMSRKSCQINIDNSKTTVMTYSTRVTKTFNTTNTPNVFEKLITATTTTPNATRIINNPTLPNIFTKIHTTDSTSINKENAISGSSTTTLNTAVPNNMNKSCVRSCKGIPSGNYHSCTGCNVFATCSQGILFDNRPCEAHLVWNDRFKRCDVHTTTCQVPSKDCVTSCVGLESGDYQSCKGCNVYITCSNGFKYDNRPCPAKLLWNDITKTCEYESPTCKSEEVI